MKINGMCLLCAAGFLVVGLTFVTFIAMSAKNV